MEIKNRQRVEKFGEVFTSEREVKSLLDLIEAETQRIESRFLEPACGTGNFLAEILRRKLAVVVKRYGKSQLEFERFSILAITSIYGIDILEDNVEECRTKLCKIFKTFYLKRFRNTYREACIRSVQYILENNIICGDALSLKISEQDCTPIVFVEWSPVNGSMIKRRDYIFEQLNSDQSTKGEAILSDLGDDAFIPQPINEYPLTHFLELPSHVKCKL